MEFSKDQYFNFIEKNIGELIQIIIKEKCDKGDGALFIGYNNDTKQIDCAYIPLSEEFFPAELREIYINLHKENPSTVIYINLEIDKKNEIIQYDLDKRNIKV